MAREDKRLRKPVFPDNKIGKLLEKADKLKYEKIYNYKYSYYIKTPNGMREDTSANHEYGDEREGYEAWQKDNRNLRTSYSGVTSVREIYASNKPDEILGFMFEEKLSNEPWLEEIDNHLEEAWKEFVILLDIKDEEMVKYFLFSEVNGSYTTDGQDRITKFNIMLDTLEKYDDENEEDYKFLIDKIKG